jgi:hypothetical protein
LLAVTAVAGHQALAVAAADNATNVVANLTLVPTVICI